MIELGVSLLNWGRPWVNYRKVVSRVRFGFTHLNWGRPGEGYIFLQYESNPKVAELNYKSFVQVMAQMLVKYAPQILH